MTFKLKEINSYFEMKEMTKRASYQIVRKNIHPIMVLLSKYDYRVKRVVKMLVFMLKVALITFKMLIWNIGRNSDIHFGANPDLRPYILALMTCNLTLPFPDCLMSIFSTQMVP